MDSSILDKERGVIRTGSIPHKSSESLKARLKAEGEKSDLDLPPKPEMKKSPKPEVQQKVRVEFFHFYCISLLFLNFLDGSERFDRLSFQPFLQDEPLKKPKLPMGCVDSHLFSPRFFI